MIVHGGLNNCDYFEKGKQERLLKPMKYECGGFDGSHRMRDILAGERREWSRIANISTDYFRSIRNGPNHPP